MSRLPFFTTFQPSFAPIHRPAAEEGRQKEEEAEKGRHGRRAAGALHCANPIFKLPRRRCHFSLCPSHIRIVFSRASRPRQIRMGRTRPYRRRSGRLALEVFARCVGRSTRADATARSRASRPFITLHTPHSPPTLPVPTLILTPRLQLILTPPAARRARRCRLTHEKH